MVRRPDLESVLVLGPGADPTSRARDFDACAQACRVLRSEGIRVVLIDPNPAATAVVADFAHAVYAEPLVPEFVEAVIARESPEALLPVFGGKVGLDTATAFVQSGALDQLGVELIGVALDLSEFNDMTMGLVRGRRRYRPEFGSPPMAELSAEQGTGGWREYELELVADAGGGVVVVGSVEPVARGTHVPDSITVAPPMTLSEPEYQRMSEISAAVLREAGGNAGVCNVRFAVDPADGQPCLVDLLPRVSCSSALLSRVSGFPVAQVVAKVAIGYRLNDIVMDQAGVIPASVEPVAQRVSVDLTTGSASIGASEGTGIGGTFSEALQKALRSADPSGSFSWEETVFELKQVEALEACAAARSACSRMKAILLAIRAQARWAEIAEAARIDVWFVNKIAELNDVAVDIRQVGALGADLLRRAKRSGFSDAQIAQIRRLRPESVREVRYALGVQSACRAADACLPELAAPAHNVYSCYDADVVEPRRSRPVVVIPSGWSYQDGWGFESDRIGAGRASSALWEAGFDTASIGCHSLNSAAQRSGGRSYLEAPTLENVLEVVRSESRTGTVAGVFVPFGGQAAHDLSRFLVRAGVPILGAESAGNHTEPPTSAVGLTEIEPSLDVTNAAEIEVDALYDGTELYVGGVVEHVEREGTYDGGSVCVQPPISLGHREIARIRECTEERARTLGIRGLINVRFAVGGDALHVLAARPRATRTVPFVSAITGVELAEAAAVIAVGATIGELREQGVLEAVGDGGSPATTPRVAIMKSVQPWSDHGGEVALAPKRAAEAVMGIGPDFGTAFAKAHAAARVPLPTRGRAFVSVGNRDKRAVILPVMALVELGFDIVATQGTARVLWRSGVVTSVVEAGAAAEPAAATSSIVGLIETGTVDLVVHTASDDGEQLDGSAVRAAAFARAIPCIGAVDGLAAAVHGIQSLTANEPAVQPLREVRSGQRRSSVAAHKRNCRGHQRHECVERVEGARAEHSESVLEVPM